MTELNYSDSLHTGEVQNMFNLFTAKFAFMRMPTDCRIRIYANMNLGKHLVLQLSRFVG